MVLNQLLNNTLNPLIKKYQMILKNNKNKVKLIFQNKQSNNLVLCINQLSLKGIIILII
jgi:hypothetical protein